MGKNINVDLRCDMAGAYEIVSDCFRVVIIEKNNEEQGNSTPKRQRSRILNSFKSYRI